LALQQSLGIHPLKMKLPELASKAQSGAELSREEIQIACDLLLDSTNPIEERADFLSALHHRGETPSEVASFVEVLLKHGVQLPIAGTGRLDVCGTGGDRAGFFNISTAVMFVAAGAGASVVKHGNRGITSKSGGADVLEALGVNINLPTDRSAAALEAAGCCFLFAPACHPAFKAVVPVRQFLAQQGRASVFNILGPLLNPVRPQFQLSGVYDPSLLPTYAGVFQKLGRQRAWAIHGTGPDGLRLDEVSPYGKTQVLAVEDTGIREFQIDPADFELSPASPNDLLGGDAATNARILLSILDGSERGPKRQVVQLNAAAALTVAGIAPSMTHGWTQAGDAIDSGRAMNSLEHLRTATH
jgi:anthranilate phosphoribosyltransferase